MPPQSIHPECRHPMHDNDCDQGCESPVAVEVCTYCAREAYEYRPNPSNPKRLELVCDWCASDLDKGRALDKWERERGR